MNRELGPPYEPLSLAEIVQHATDEAIPMVFDGDGLAKTRLTTPSHSHSFDVVLADQDNGSLAITAPVDGVSPTPKRDRLALTWNAQRRAGQPTLGYDEDVKKYALANDRERDERTWPGVLNSIVSIGDNFDSAWDHLTGYPPGHRPQQK